MTGTPPEGSGNRWEPSSDQPPPTEPPTSAETAPVQPVVHTEPAADPYADAYAEPPADATEPSWRANRAFPWLAGSAAAVLLAAGVGGFAIGRTTGDEGSGRVDQQDVSSGFDGDDHRGDLPGGPGVGPGEGFAPPDGAAPDRDGEDHDDDDGDHDDDSSDT